MKLSAKQKKKYLEQLISEGDKKSIIKTKTRFYFIQHKDMLVKSESRKGGDGRTFLKQYEDRTALKSRIKSILSSEVVSVDAEKAKFESIVVQSQESDKPRKEEENHQAELSKLRAIRTKILRQQKELSEDLKYIEAKIDLLMKVDPILLKIKEKYS